MKMRNITVVGGSPSARKYLPHVLALETTTIIACNSGIGLCLEHDRVPEYIMLVDPVAVKVYLADARKAMGLGSTLVTTTASVECCQGLGLQPSADHIINMPTRQKSVQLYRPNEWIHPRFTGLVALQWAANYARNRVDIVGLDGYRSHGDNLVADTVDGRLGKSMGLDKTFEWTQPFVQSVVDRAQHLDFYQWGHPIYSVDGYNYSVMQEDKIGDITCVLSPKARRLLLEMLGE